mgnify:CR=1 FL=1
MGEMDAFRSEEFIRERGAPCPKAFTLSAEERGGSRVMMRMMMMVAVVIRIKFE